MPNKMVWRRYWWLLLPNIYIWQVIFKKKKVESTRWNMAWNSPNPTKKKWNPIKMRPFFSLEWSKARPPKFEVLPFTWWINQSKNQMRNQKIVEKKRTHFLLASSISFQPKERGKEGLRSRKGKGLKCRGNNQIMREAEKARGQLLRSKLRSQ